MEPQPQTSPVVPPQPVEQSPSLPTVGHLKSFLLAVLILLLGGIIIYVFQRYQPQQDVQIVPPTEPSPTHALNETSEWKTYTNEKYGFEFQYPNTMFHQNCGLYAFAVVCLSFFDIGSTPMFSQGGHDGNEYTTVAVQKHNLTLEQLKDELLTNPSNSSESFQISELSGYKISGDSSIMYLFTSPDNLIYSYIYEKIK